MSGSASPRQRRIAIVYAGADGREHHRASIHHHRQHHARRAAADHGSESPSAKWRMRFAETGGALRAQPYYFAFVTESALIRGGFPAVLWLRGERRGHHLAAFATFEQACAWVRESTGAAYPSLEALHAAARACGLITRSLARSFRVAYTEGEPWKSSSAI